MIDDLIPSNDEIKEAVRRLKLTTLQSQADSLIDESQRYVNAVEPALENKQYRAARIAIVKAINAQEAAGGIYDQMLEVVETEEEENKVRKMLVLTHNACSRMARILAQLPAPEPK